jgi:uncharacterized surface protein with fasciclin (FAS1) repeats
MDARLRICSAFLLAALALTACSHTTSDKTAAATRTVEPTRTVVDTAPPAAQESTEVVKNKKATIAGIAKKSPGLSTLNELIDAAGMTKVLDSHGPYTFFTPTNAAFSKLPPGWLDKLKEPGNIEKLRRLLRYHLVTGRVDLGAMLQYRQLMTYEGGLLTVHQKDPTIFLNKDATITAGAIAASNGMIHVTDTVLVPKGFTP